jgi:hypothetical protein
LCFCLGHALFCYIPIYSSHVAGIIEFYHHAWGVGWEGSLANFFPGLASNSNPPDLHLPGMWDYKYFGV